MISNFLFLFSFYVSATLKTFPLFVWPKSGINLLKERPLEEEDEEEEIFHSVIFPICTNYDSIFGYMTSDVIFQFAKFIICHSTHLPAGVYLP